MDNSQQLMFALQSPVGLHFGVTTAVDSDRISFEMDLKIPKGTSCPFRMELSGAEETVLGTIRIERSMPKRGNNLPRYVGRILDMPPLDREKFDGWRGDLATGGVSRKLERDPEKLKDQMSQNMMSGLSESESKAVLERMNQRRSRTLQTESEAVVDFGLAEETEASAPKERPNIREKLRQDAEVQQDGDPVAVIEPAPAPTAPAPPKPAPPKSTVPRPQPPPAPASHASGPPPSPPLVVVNGDSRPIEVTIIYLSAEAFAVDYASTLHTSAVTLDHPALTELYQPVDVKIQLASGEEVSVMGQMVAKTPAGMAIALEFNTAQRAQLVVAAGV